MIQLHFKTNLVWSKIKKLRKILEAFNICFVLHAYAWWYKAN